MTGAVLSDPRIGTETAGYAIESLLGRGGMGVVYLARDPWLERRVALKLVAPELSADPRFRDRFLRESKLAASLEHAYVVPIYEAGEDAGLLYLAMRYIEGTDLGALLEQRHRLDPEAVLRLLGPVGVALDAAHEKDLVHRDVKPGNILLGRLASDDVDGIEYAVYLSDFGLTKSVDDEGALTARGEFAGTLDYAAPEQIEGTSQTAQTDVYALGCVLYQCLVGTVPFPEGSPVARMWAHLETDPPKPSTHGHDLPAKLDAVMSRALAKEPSERYESCVALIDAAAEALGLAETQPRETETPGARFGPHRNPYKGLRAFDESDADDFFGREALVDELLERLATERFLTVVGPSGSGKSSVVRAGLLPAVRADTRWRIAEMVPGNHPLEELEAALLRLAPDPASIRIGRLHEDRDGLARCVESIVDDADTHVLLVVDQFEELFTLVVDDKRREWFLELLCAAAEGNSPIRIVVTLRADFFDRPLRHRNLATLVEAGQVTVLPLSAAELERAIDAPARRVGLQLEQGLVAEIIADVVDRPGALPLLQHALSELYERREGNVLTHEAYRELGGVPGALGRRAEEIYARLDDQGQLAAHSLFTRLVALGEGTEDTRRRVLQSEVEAIERGAAAMPAVLDAYGRQRLLTFDRDLINQRPTVEIAHEALLREWPRLRAWIDDDRDGLRLLRQISQAATTWDESSREQGDLYRGARLEQALLWQESHPTDLNPLEHEFLAEGRGLRDAEGEAERERTRHRVRQNRRLRIALVVIGIALVGAIVAGVLALGQSRRADREADQATNAQAAAETRRLAADAAQVVNTNPRVALLLAAEAFNRDPGPLGLGALQQVLTQTGAFLGYLGSDRNWRDIAFLESTRVAGVSNEGVSVFDVTDGSELLSIPLTGASVLATSPDHGTAAVSTESGIRLVDLDEGILLEDTLDQAGEVVSMAFSSNGDLLAVGGRDGLLHVWNVPDRAVEITIEAHPERGFGEVEGVPPNLQIGAFHQPESVPLGVTSVSFNAGGSELVTSGLVLVRRWDVATGQLLMEALVDRPTGSGDRALTAAIGVDFAPARADAIRIGTGFSLLYLDAETGAIVDERPLRERQNFGGAQPLLSSVALGEEATMLGFTPGNQAVVVTGDQTILFDSRLTGRPSVALASDDRTAAYAGDGGILLWAVDGRRLIAKAFPARVDDGFTVVVNPDGTKVYFSTAGGVDGEIWDISSSEPRVLDTPKGVPHFFWAGDAFFSREADSTVLGRDPETIESTGITYGTASAIAASGSPDGRLVAIGTGGTRETDDDPVVRVYEIATGESVVELAELVELAGSDGVVSSVDFSSDGSRLAASTGDGASVVWRTDTWDPVGPPISAGGGAVVSVAYARDDRWLLTTSIEGTVTLRDPTTFQPDGPPLISGTDGNEDYGTGPSFTPDGRYFLTVGDGNGRLWDIEERTLVGGAFTTDLTNAAGTSEEAAVLGTIVGDHVLIWDIDVDSWHGIACRAAGRNMTPVEWEQFGPTDRPYRATCKEWPSLGQTSEREAGS